MLWLEDIESEDNLIVAKWHISEWAKEVCVKIDDLDKRLETVEGVMEHGHHEAPVVTVVGSLTPEQEAADWDDEGDPGECPECGAPYQIVRPGKTQSSCRCDEVRQLTEEVAELRRRLAEKPVGLLAENEELKAENGRLRAGWARVHEKAVIGEMVLEMPKWSGLRRRDIDWACRFGGVVEHSIAPTAEAALHAAREAELKLAGEVMK